MTKHSIEILDVTRWIDEIDCVFKSAYTVEAELLGLERFPPLEREKNDILSCGHCFIGSISNNELCGVVELETPACAESETTIASLAVSPSHFRQGIGRALVQNVLEKEDRHFRVTTGTLSRPAIDLYTAQGFELAGNFTTPDGVAMVELVFRAKQICPPHNTYCVSFSLRCSG